MLFVINAIVFAKSFIFILFFFFILLKTIQNDKISTEYILNVDFIVVFDSNSDNRIKLVNPHEIKN